MKRLYTMTELPIDVICYENDAWYRHPELEIEVNDAGTHLFDCKTGVFKQIRKCTWKNGWIELIFSVASRKKRFSRLACECFMGRKFLPRETVEHVDRNCENNQKGNLLPRFKLFQASNRQQV